MPHPDVSQALAKYEAAKSALQACKSVDEVKDWSDRAAATQAYARMAKDKGLEVDAAEIRIRAERRLGEMIREQKASVGLAKSGPKNNSVVGEDRIPSLAEVGVSKDLSARAQKLAAVPEPQFEAEVSDWRERVEEEGVRVSARLEAAGKKALEEEGDAPEAYSEEDMQAEYAADFEAMARIIDSDDKLSAAVGELRVMRKQLATVTALHDDKGREVAIITKEAARWMRKAKKAAACTACKSALGEA